LAPTNGLAVVRLAARILEEDPKDNPRRLGEADFLSRRALQFAPNDAEVAKLRADIATYIEASKQP
jgi:hypothetical protein